MCRMFFVAFALFCDQNTWMCVCLQEKETCELRRQHVAAHCVTVKQRNTIFTHLNGLKRISELNSPVWQNSGRCILTFARQQARAQTCCQHAICGNMKREPDCVWHESIRGKMFPERPFRFNTGLDGLGHESAAPRAASAFLCKRFLGRLVMTEHERTAELMERHKPAPFLSLHTSSSGSDGNRRWIIQNLLAGVFTYSWLYAHPDWFTLRSMFWHLLPLLITLRANWWVQIVQGPRYV